MNAILEIVFLVAFNALVFWQGDKRKFLWVLGAVCNVILGLNYSVGAMEYSATWMIGFLIALLGFYCITEFALWSIGIFKSKKVPRKE